MKKIIYQTYTLLLFLFLFSSCNTQKFLQEDELLLKKVELISADNSVHAVDYEKFILQRANSKWFNLIKAPMALYTLSPADTSRRKGRFFRKMGEALVVYDTLLTKNSRRNLINALRAHGFLRAKVDVETKLHGRKIDVVYNLRPGTRYNIEEFSTYCDDESMQLLNNRLDHQSLVRPGSPLDTELLGKERSRRVNELHHKGYYGVVSDLYTYQVDTSRYHTSTRVTLLMRHDKEDSLSYKPYYFRNIRLMENHREIFPECKKNNQEVKSKVYLGHMFIYPGHRYNDFLVSNSFASLNNLPAVRYASIHLLPDSLHRPFLDVDVDVMTEKPQRVGMDVEGTNTSGDLGAALTLSYNHLNLLHHSEFLQLKLRAAYEAITRLEAYHNKNYLEYGVDLLLKLPASRILFSSLGTSQKSNRIGYVIDKSLSLIYNSQNRPEFHRRTLTGKWTARWHKNSTPHISHELDYLGVNYVFMPWISSTFRDQYLNENKSRYAILRSNYEDLLIAGSRYTFLYTTPSVGEQVNPFSTGQINQQRLRFSIETAGNILQGVGKLFNVKHNALGQHELFNIAFSQFLKFDIDYARHIPVDPKNSFALHGNLGVAFPYGNSRVVPFEKRYFAGGANSMRGWNVRSLGPGKYTEGKDEVNCIHRSGDIKLEFNVEWRTHLLGLLDGAAFWDFGNIWNIHQYPGIDGGRFKFDSFYRQIAASYGLGLRFNLSYLILRFDFGMKAINPAYQSRREHYPILHPNFKRDLAWHLAIGLPF